MNVLLVEERLISVLLCGLHRDLGLNVLERSLQNSLAASFPSVGIVIVSAK